MTARDPIALTARFLEACGREVKDRRSHDGLSSWWFARPIEGEELDAQQQLDTCISDGWYEVPDLTVEGELGRVVRMVWERWPDRPEIDIIFNHGDPVSVRLWIDWSEDDRCFGYGDNLNTALMLAAIDAAGLERPEGW